MSSLASPVASTAAPVRFQLPVPIESRVVGCLTIAVLLCGCLAGFANAGAVAVDRTLHAHPVDIALLLLLCVLTPLIFILPPRRWLARLELSPAHLTLVCDVRARIVSGEKSQELDIPSAATELLLYRRIQRGHLPGYRIAALDAARVEHGIGSSSTYSRLAWNPRQATRLSEALHATTGLPVRMFTRTESASGAVDTDAPAPPSSFGIVALISGSVLLPVLSGAMAGWLTLTPAAALSLGIAVWIASGLALHIYFRIPAPRKPFPALRFLVTTIPLGSLYAVCYVVENALRAKP